MKQVPPDYRDEIRRLYVAASTEDHDKEARALRNAVQAVRKRKAQAVADRLPAQLVFDPDKLYPLCVLEMQLAGIMSLKTFLERLKLDCTGRGRMFQHAVFGHEILKAMQAMAEGDKTPEMATEACPSNAPRLPRKPGRPRKQPVAPVHDIGRKAEARR